MAFFFTTDNEHLQMARIVTNAYITLVELQMSFMTNNPRFIFQMAFFTAAHLLVDSDRYTNFHKTYVFWVQTLMEIVFLKNIV